LVVAYSLEQLYDHFKAFELHEEADALNEAIRVAGTESLADMKEISVEAEIPKEKIESYVVAMLEGTREQILLRIAVHFIPRRGALEEQLRELAQKAPISYLIPRTIKDDEGRTVARIGSLDSDLEGQLLLHISQSMHLSSIWLRETIQRSIESGHISTDVILNFLLQSPLYQAPRRQILEAGLNTYVKGDTLASIHILIPQIEQALHRLAILVGAPIYTPRRGGGLQIKTLDGLLRDNAIIQSLTDDVATYLRILLTDPRGWNVRNSVCHGLAPIGMLTMPVADRVVHALLVLSLIREQS
jgi:hypothetical protein